MPSSMGRPRVWQAWRTWWTTRLAGSARSRFSICASASESRSASFLIIRTAISELPRIIPSKVLGSMTRSLASSATVAVAFRGLLEMIAISPKNSPGPERGEDLLHVPHLLVMATFPAWRTNISLPGSPSRKRTVPLGNSLPNRWKRVSSAPMWACESGVERREVNQLPADGATSLLSRCDTPSQQRSAAAPQRCAISAQVAARDAVLGPGR